MGSAKRRLTVVIGRLRRDAMRGSSRLLPAKVPAWSRCSFATRSSSIILKRCALLSRRANIRNNLFARGRLYTGYCFNEKSCRRVVTAPHFVSNILLVLSM